MFNRNLFLLAAFMAATILFSCKKSDPVIRASRAFHENFDSLDHAIARGWVAINNSKPIGTTTWRQGVYEIIPDGTIVGFPAKDWTNHQNEYAYCDYTCAGGLATISCWLISPELNLRNGDTVRFWTRTVNPVLYPDRMQVRVNISNSSVDVGNDPESVGDFNILALDINQDLTKTGYPTLWHQFSWVVEGLHGMDVGTARVAFRYYVQNGGPSPDSKNSDTIGIDEFSVSPAN